MRRIRFPDGFAGYRVLQRSLKRVFSESAQNPRIGRTSRFLRRPIHELSKMENKGCLDPVFFGGCLRLGSFPAHPNKRKKVASNATERRAREVDKEPADRAPKALPA
jgi:hypothetical protein